MRSAEAEAARIERINEAKAEGDRYRSKSAGYTTPSEPPTLPDDWPGVPAEIEQPQYGRDGKVIGVRIRERNVVHMDTDAMDRALYPKSGRPWAQPLYDTPDDVEPDMPEIDLWEILPHPQAEVIYMHVHERLTIAEIALKLEVPIGTVASRYARAKATLRGALQHLA
jgi:hypothetical protein